MVNTHGLKMIGLKAACQETVNWDPRSGGHTQISYDKSTGEIFATDHIGQSWTVYHDINVVTFHTTKHMTMQEIADRIAETVAMSMCVLK